MANHAPVVLLIMQTRSLSARAKLAGCTHASKGLLPHPSSFCPCLLPLQHFCLLFSWHAVSCPHRLTRILSRNMAHFWYRNYVPYLLFVWTDHTGALTSCYGHYHNIVNQALVMLIMLMSPLLEENTNHFRAGGDITYWKSQLVVLCERWANGSKLRFYHIPAVTDKHFFLQSLTLFQSNIACSKYCYACVACWCGILLGGFESSLVMTRSTLWWQTT